MVYFLSLGSNLGDRTRNLAQARKFLRENGAEVLRASSVYETEPVDHLDQGWFLNQVLEVRSFLDPRALLKLAKSIEARQERVPTVDKGPRTIDIDILLAGDTVLEGPDLVVPHPRLAQRNFVLVPLCEIAPETRHPVLGKTIRELALSSSDPARVIARKRKRT
ncbi:MAG TPA: 2-amino-4-hydroxy-6-hydroxymethyldihydropteridine diphosphokinase [Candidatus Latescibacteria bacterium]|nr:2-amino-4-hydroxy-6-hydroxymethyldihydropteridine diphosphokinase [Candidatus Latescibacterota bacterium]